MQTGLPSAELIRPLAKSLDSHQYGCVMVLLPKDFRLALAKWSAENVQEEDLWPEGWEEHPHITVKYGFTDSSPATAAAVRSLLVQHGPVRIRLQGLSLFQGGKDGDVLKVDVDSPDLHVLNKALSETFPCKDTHPNYIPHITIAYLDPEVSDKYDGMEPPFLGQELVLDRGEWGGADGHKEAFLLPYIIRSRQETMPMDGTKGSYFHDCPRDPEGHCKPSGQGDESGRQGGKKPASSYSQAAYDWLDQYVFGKEGKDPSRTELPDDETITEFGKYVPKMPLFLFRYVEQEKGSGSTGQQLRSWTHSREYAESLLEGHDDKGKVVRKRFYPNEILVDSTLLPEEYQEAQVAGQQEVIVAYGDTLKRMQKLRGTAPPDRPPGRSQKAMSAMSDTSGGALVAPPQQGLAGRRKCLKCGKAIAKAGAGWRCTNPDCNWSLFQGGDVDSHSPRDLRLRYRDKGIFASIETAAAYLADKWSLLEERYGRRAALAMAVAMVASGPLPGSIPAIVAAAEAIRGMHGYFGRPKSFQSSFTKAWVTIGGHPCEEGGGEHCGGTKVEIEGGVVRKGPKKLVGKKPGQDRKFKPERELPKPSKPTQKPEPAKEPEESVEEEVISSNYDVPKGMESTAKAYLDKLPEEQLTALKAYIGSDYHTVNKQMRDCPEKLDCLDDETRDLYERIEAALEKAPVLDKPIRVYRGINLSKMGYDAGKFIDALETAYKEGKDIRFPSITSTTLNPAIGLGFTGGKGVVFQITTRRGLYVAPVSSYSSEQEVVQSPKTRYRIARIADRHYGSKALSKVKTIYLEPIE